jgi:gluconolactonase
VFTNLRVVASGLRFPEGPVTLPNGDVLVVEMARGTLSRVTPQGAIEVVAETGGSPNSAAIGPEPDGRAYICQAGGFRFHEPKPGLLVPGYQPPDYTGGRIQVVDMESGKVEDLYTECNDNRLSGPNDIVFDDEGGFWFTDHGKVRKRDRDHGGIYYAKADGSFIREALYPVDHPNGIGLSPDGASVVFAETQQARLYRFPVVGPGVIDASDFLSLVPKDSSYLAAALTTPSLFDSLAVDAAGHVLVGTCVWNPGITEWSPLDGSIQHHVLPDDLWDPFVTNICFGGADLRTVFITSSGYGRLLAADWHSAGLALNYGFHGGPT